MRSTPEIGGNISILTWLVSARLWRNMSLMKARIALCSPTTVIPAMHSVPMIRKAWQPTGVGAGKRLWSAVNKRAMKRTTKNLEHCSKSVSETVMRLTLQDTMGCTYRRVTNPKKVIETKRPKKGSKDPYWKN